MKVLVDTSVWVDFFNGYPSEHAEILRQLIEDEAELVTCGVVIAEFLQGLRRAETLPVLEDHFRQMLSLSPREPETYISAAQLFRDLRKQGKTIRSTIDCMIAVLASEHDVLLLAKDRDMTTIIQSELLPVRGLPFTAEA